MRIFCGILWPRIAIWGTCGTDMNSPLQVKDRAGWRAWLEKHHATEKEVWLLLYKKRAARPGLSLEDAVEEALCFGWIDGRLRRIDDQKHVLRFSPRRRGSIWSESNKGRAQRMIEQGRMTQAGLTKVREARENGEWDRAALREDVTFIPSDLHAALQANGMTRTDFENLVPSLRKQYLWWIASAKTDPTRRKRIAETVRLVEARRGPATG
ncbi:MAG: YdeI/OmpD-associated family protein [Anaerolineae bacterium]|nr:YdeI/OmpD-associated family protein [Anaerolineae bacterium]